MVTFVNIICWCAGLPESGKDSNINPTLAWQQAPRSCLSADDPISDLEQIVFRSQKQSQPRCVLLSSRPTST